jgi:hypothetical protein
MNYLIFRILLLKTIIEYTSNTDLLLDKVSDVIIINFLSNKLGIFLLLNNIIHLHSVNFEIVLIIQS